VLRRIFGPRREEESGVWRKLHNEELHNLFHQTLLGDQVKENEIGGVRSTHERVKNCV
jgi:hypothetical protein